MPVAQLYTGTADARGEECFQCVAVALRRLLPSKCARLGITSQTASQEQRALQKPFAPANLYLSQAAGGNAYAGLHFRIQALPGLELSLVPKRSWLNPVRKLLECYWRLSRELGRHGTGGLSIGLHGLRGVHQRLSLNAWEWKCIRSDHVGCQSPGGRFGGLPRHCPEDGAAEGCSGFWARRPDQFHIGPPKLLCTRVGPGTARPGTSP